MRAEAQIRPASPPTPPRRPPTLIPIFFVGNRFREQEARSGESPGTLRQARSLSPPYEDCPMCGTSCLMKSQKAPAGWAEMTLEGVRCEPKNPSRPSRKMENDHPLTRASRLIHLI